MSIWPLGGLTKDNGFKTRILFAESTRLLQRIAVRNKVSGDKL
jgi:hypothetical protein